MIKNVLAINVTFSSELEFLQFFFSNLPSVKHADTDHLTGNHSLWKNIQITVGDLLGSLQHSVLRQYRFPYRAGSGQVNRSGAGPPKISRSA